MRRISRTIQGLNQRLYNLKLYVFIYAASLLVIIYVTETQLNWLQTEMLVKNMNQSGIDYDAFRDIQITEEALRKADNRIMDIIHQYPELQNYNYIDPIGYLTFSMMAQNYNLEKYKLVGVSTFLQGIGKVAVSENFQELYTYYKAIIMDLMFFPVPIVESSQEEISYGNTWCDLRQYGGNRRHEGTDLMASNNQRGFFPVVSMTDGVVENLGWLEKGGNRIGIRSRSGGYFYYAHLHSYAPELKAGDEVIAGQLLGFMGDSGYGSEGTVGQFDVHLHLGIYVQTSTGEMSINPYRILKMLEDRRTRYAND